MRLREAFTAKEGKVPPCLKTKKKGDALRLKASAYEDRMRELKDQRSGKDHAPSSSTGRSWRLKRERKQHGDDEQEQLGEERMSKRAASSSGMFGSIPSLFGGWQGGFE